MMASVSVDGTRIEHDNDPEAPGYVTVEFDTDDAYRFRCVHCQQAVDESGTGDDGSKLCDGRCSECGRPLDYDADGSDAQSATCDGIGAHLCADDCPAAVDECDSLKCNGIVPVKPVHVPEPMALSWVNSAGISVDEESDEITVSISVGDPRGAFAMTVRRITPDDGDPYLIMHTPYPGMSWAHMPLTELHTGTYRVMDYGWTAPVEPEPEPVPALPVYAAAVLHARGYLSRWERARLAGRMLLSLVSFRIPSI